MKNKKQLIALVGMLCAAFLGGCGNDFARLSEVQIAQAGEYAAVTLLQYDTRQRSRLVDLSVIEKHDRREQERQERKEAEANGQESEDSVLEEQEVEIAVPEILVSLEESLAVPEGIHINYTGYQFCQSYPEDGSADAYLALDASPGKTLLALKFEAQNHAAQEIPVSLFGVDSSFRLQTADLGTVNAMVTMLPEDLSTFEGQIASGQRQPLVLLFEVERADADLTDAILIHKTGSGTERIRLEEERN